MGAIEKQIKLIKEASANIKAKQLRLFIKDYLKKNGTDSLAKVISDAVDDAGKEGLFNNQSINACRENLTNKLISYNKLNLTYRA